MATMIVIRKGKSPRSICRLCFMEREQHQPIFASDSSSLDEWIGNLISLKIVDAPNAPASLCSECKATLEDFESFIEMCRTNDCVFNDMFVRNNQITEVSDRQHAPAADPTVPLDSGATIEYQNFEEEPLHEENDHSEQLEESNTDESIQSKQVVLRNKNASEKKRKKERCGICRIYVYNIDEHALSHNESYQCELCPKAFAKKSLLNAHIHRHKLQRTFVCKECNKAFKYAIDLRNHIRIHTQEKPYKCKECDSAYRARTNLSRHEKTHKKYNYECEHCKSGFTTAAELERHSRQVVRDKYWCKVCKMKFSTCAHLVYHRKAENH